MVWAKTAAKSWVDRASGSASTSWRAISGISCSTSAPRSFTSAACRAGFSPFCSRPATDRESRRRTMICDDSRPSAAAAVPFGRRGSTTPQEDPPPADVATVDEGKGRPTPKRSEARKARRNPSPGGNRKEAAAAQRDRNRLERQRARQALITGDERYLPARDAGPERRLARDVVDARFTLGQIFLGMIVVAFASGFVANRIVQDVSSLASLVALTLIVADSARCGRAAKMAVAERFPSSEVRGITTYGFLRAMLPRRFRRPPPKVKRGGEPI